VRPPFRRRRHAQPSPPAAVDDLTGRGYLVVSSVLGPAEVAGLRRRADGPLGVSEVAEVVAAIEARLAGWTVTALELRTTRPGSGGGRPGGGPTGGTGPGSGAELWVALDDVVGHAGQLRVLPRSHLLAVGSDPPAWWGARAFVEERLVHCPCPAGHGVLLVDGLARTWFPNHGDAPVRSLSVRLVGPPSPVAPAVAAAAPAWPGLLAPGLDAVAAVLAGDPSPPATDGSRSFDEDGSAPIRLWADDELAVLRRIVASLDLPEDHGFYVSVRDDCGPVAATVDRRVKEALGPALARRFPDHRPLMVAVTSKGTSPGGVHFHHDVTYNDERLGRPLFLWCPLVDVGPGEGSLWVVPGSHRWHRRARPTRRRGRPVVTERFQRSLAAAAQEVPLWAGDALAFDGGVLHGSPPTGPPTGRPAVTIALIPRSAPAATLHEETDGTLRGFLVPDDYFTSHPFGEPPEGCPPLEAWAPAVTEADLEAALDRRGLLLDEERTASGGRDVTP